MKQRVISYIESTFWACRAAEFDALCRIAYRESDKLDAILSASEFDEEGNVANFDSMLAKGGERLAGSRYTEVRENGVAVIDVSGVIAKRMSFFREVCYGGTSTENLLKDFNVALNSANVSSIVLHIDSPGGEAFGINELAQAIYDARGKKPIKAYVSGLGCSGAYWIAAACDEIVCDKSAFLGSIGVVTSWTDDKGFYKALGIRREVVTSTNAPFKRLDFDNDDHRAELQRELDSLESVFHKSVAKYRGVTVEQVKKDFNQGGVLAGSDAVKAKMADRTGSLEQVVKDLAKKKKPMSGLNAETEGDFDMSWKDKFKAIGAELGFNVSEKEPETSAENEPNAENENPTFLAAKTQTDAEQRLAKAEADLAQVKQEKLESEADGFIGAEVASGRMNPAEKDEFKSLYLQAAADDSASPLATGSRLDNLKAIQSKRSSSGLTTEQLDPKAGLQAVKPDMSETAKLEASAEQQVDDYIAATTPGKPKLEAVK